MSNGLYYALYFVGAVITHYLIISMMSNIIDRKPIINFKIIIHYIVLNILNYAFDISDIFIFKNILVIANIIVFVKILFQLSLKETVIDFLKLFSMILFTELLLGITIGYIFKIHDINRYGLLTIKMIGILITYCTNIIYYCFTMNKGYYFKYNVSCVFLLIMLCLLINIGTLNFISTYNYNLRFYLLFITMLVFVIYCILLIIKLIKKNYAINYEIINLKNKNVEVEKYINDFKIYKHNLRYSLLSIKEYGNATVNSKINDLLNKNDNELDYINNFKELPSNLIHIFSDRLSINNDNNISVIIKNTLKDKELIIKEKCFLDLYEIIGNCLTNAIEAMPKDNGIIYVNFFESNKKQIISIVNNFNNTIDFDKIGLSNYSTKNRGSGFGLYSIFSNSNNNINVRAKIINNLFNIEIVIS